jgi:hypothetical protein
MLAINILQWPGFNQALILAILVLVALIVGAVLYGKRRPVGKPISWGEGMLAATYVFFAMFMAYAVVPNQWLLHAQNGLGWRSDKKVYGPGNIFQAQSLGGSFPFEINYLQVGDAIAAGIYIVLLGVQLYLLSWWQRRGKAKPSAELATSTYGRPLVRKG